MPVTYDNHTHIGTFYECHYDYRFLFKAMKNNGINGATFAYLTPLFTESEPALNFYKAMTAESQDALAFAKEIGFDAQPLYWVDPMALMGGLKLDSVLSDINYKGLVVHPFLNDWNPEKRELSNLLTEVFAFAEKHHFDIYFHTGCSATDNPLLFEKWYAQFPSVKVHLAHCKDPDPIIQLFQKYDNLVGDTAFCPDDSYEAICDAGFKDRMFFGTDFPITHWYEHRRDEDRTQTEEIMTESYARSKRDNCFRE